MSDAIAAQASLVGWSVFAVVVGSLCFVLAASVFVRSKEKGKGG